MQTRGLDTQMIDAMVEVIAEFVTPDTDDGCPLQVALENRLHDLPGIIVERTHGLVLYHPSWCVEEQATNATRCCSSRGQFLVPA